MSEQRYIARCGTGGSWSVIDRETNLTAHHRRHHMCNMGGDEADAAADMLNRLEPCKDPFAPHP